MENINFKPGDVIKVSSSIKEGNKERIQAYEGIVISIRGAGNSQTFTVRKIGAGGIGVERIWPVSSPNIKKIDVVKVAQGVRRAKLYYLRDRIGKLAKKV
ncbi:MAG: 50S ribosomal protein L19 [Candidatus Woykebacteria bacterium RIFCSPLOWO2_01_FULL_43_14]|uniref:50S ribosomal protein L19 n=2 Tax=Candidatus Woykeibacteriota TaxID=1817899 RepID=A0A1G1WZ76_9BACT|nr:MAG: 50S ribosomal protein L19 [Candidatus Woykebacteria bacterium RIFCSPHIGHO2_02_FULL_43_16b]OGY32871.1 MAG: 50S ribosomal protein L19 [Candidatus Woykebacteria bacterium RIFCSPLOWO2_01_FULL_43_14]